MKPVYWLLAVGIIAIGSGTNAAGPGHPGIIDRPTPPACCADGICYPNRVTWGTYPTRWRRWPTVALAPTPDGVAAPGVLDEVLPPFEAPPPEEEDRRAPPPTLPAEEAPAEDDGDTATPPATEFPPTAPTTPPGGGFTPPTGTGLTPPGDRRLDLPDTFPFDDDPPETPAEPETNGLPFGDDDLSGESDPPPRPPFSMPAIAEGTSPRPAVRPASSPVRRPEQRPLPSSSDDPPPALPTALASAL